MNEQQIEIIADIEPYTRVFNGLICDGNLRLQTKMVLIMMLSKPPSWDFSIRGMAKIAGVTKDTMSKMIRELEEAGYLQKKEQSRSDGGHFSKAGYLVAGKPLFLQGADASCPKFYDTDSPCPNLPYTKEPYTKNSPQVINKQVINKQENSLPREVFEMALAAIRPLVVPDDDSSAEDTIFLALEAAGFSCQHKAPVPSRGPDAQATGRIGLLAARDGVTIAIEVDKRMARQKSIYKLLHFPCDYRLIVLRNSPNTTPPKGIDGIVSLAVADEPDLFQQFWDEYPKKVDKQRAKRIFQSLKVTSEMLAVMLDALRKQKTSRQWREDGGRYVPHASTWLNGHRWEDDVDSGPNTSIQAAAPRLVETGGVEEW